MNEVLLAADPGTKYTGYAVYRKAKIQATGKDFVLSAYGLIRPAKQKDLWMDRAREITFKFLMDVIGSHYPSHLAIELPTYEAGERGYTAARKDSTIILAFLCGRLCDAWDGYVMKQQQQGISLPPPALIPPQQWKGQQPKKVTVMRVNEFFNLELKDGIENNIADAIGLGKHVIQKMDWNLLEGLAINPERIDV